MSLWKWIGLSFAGAAAVAAAARAMDSHLETTRLSLPFARLPEAFDGLRIAHVSDLHGDVPAGLVETVRKEKPDLILCTGDLYDGIRCQKQTRQFLEQMVHIAPVYFVSGNHEYYQPAWKEEKERMTAMGVNLLDNCSVWLQRKGQSIELCGLAAPDLNLRWNAARRLEELHRSMSLLPQKQGFRILLFHRADLFETAADTQADLVLSGHLHGGHWRFLNKGLICPSDGDRVRLFPRYAQGIHTHKNSVLVVSRGLGDQMSIPRLFNRPQLNVITLKTKAGQ